MSLYLEPWRLYLSPEESEADSSAVTDWMEVLCRCKKTREIRSACSHFPLGRFHIERKGVVTVFGKWESDEALPRED